MIGVIPPHLFPDYNALAIALQIDMIREQIKFMQLLLDIETEDEHQERINGLSRNGDE